MPSASVDPERLLALSSALGPLREASRDGAEEVLGHFVEAGDRETQLAIEAFMDQAADTLRALDAAATELAGRLRVAAQSAAATERRARDSMASDSMASDSTASDSTTSDSTTSDSMASDSTNQGLSPTDAGGRFR